LRFVDDLDSDDLIQATPAEHGVVIVRCGTPKLRLDEAEHLARVIDQGHPTAKAVILNLHGVQFIDSTGISLLVRVASMRTLILCRLGPTVSDILETTGMLKLLNVDASERQAMDRFAAGNAAGPLTP
jgi:anti-anti-sigma factor